MTNITAIIRKLAHNIARQSSVSAKPISVTNSVVVFTAKFVAIDSTANLAEISINGSNYRNVPRLSSAWSSTPSPGTNLLLHQIGGAFIIIGVIVGQPELATTMGAGG